MDFVLLDNTIKEKRFPDFTTFYSISSTCFAG